MTIRIPATLLACAFAFSSLAPQVASAANVGIYGGCGGSAAPLVTAAGHTPVTVTTLDEASLSGLAVLFDNTCSYGGNAAVDAAVANGMTLIVHDWQDAYLPQMPGRPTATVTGFYSADLEIPAGSPVATGIGGTLTATSLDGGNWSTHGYTQVSSLPAGSQVLISGPLSNQAVTFAYPNGRGRVVYSNMPVQCYFTDFGCNAGTRPGMQAYVQNLIAWAAGPSFTTCAAEGYTGSKLTMCRKICESAISGSTLTSMIKLYVAAYHEQPACSR